MNILKVNQISKNFGRIQALRNVSFEIPQGSVFGILGPNGSGKTTLLSIVTDVLKPTTGNFFWFGKPSNAATRKQIGTILETPNFYAYLSGYDNLLLRQKIHQRGSPKEIQAVLELVKLSERAQSSVKTYSLGMKQRLAIAASLLGKPQVLILDEPTNGLDPIGIVEIRDLILELRKQNYTIILASHLLDEVEKVCTHTAILKQGKLLSYGKVDKILGKGLTIEIASNSLTELANFLQRQFPQAIIKKENEVLQLVLETDSVDLASLNQSCFQNGILLHHLALRKKTLETAFLELTEN